ncbi:type I glyceraldehyde-3-phosphate dehydrogenase [Desulfuribacillus stibiiarsenatis]|uniref:type I glyceraldehyde-3-phosphate dehydrogenase n=1 Tax=Desulfuribacillus stibiiarsenatis TaxID=1390249 RepID=UPI000A7578B7|nr:type I glyceraldehyde-3-phosphate dehydrogenase [Desulfuribacillus stibiiarsenatis]
MQKVNVAINGFGRIGRLVSRILLEEKYSNHLQLVAINDLTNIETLAHLLKFDSIHGTYNKDITIESDAIVIDGHKIHICKEPNPEKLPWKEMGVDVVIEATGRFKDREGVAKHLTAGAKKVVVSAPTKGEDIMMVMGVNDHLYDSSNHHVISAASCTTTCLSPVIKVLHETLEIERGLMTTIHSYTNDQVLLDFAHSDLRRARAGALSMIPTSTGAAQAVGKIIPELSGKLSGMAIRVPTPNVSCIDLVLNVKKDTSKEEVNRILQEASQGEMKSVMYYSELPLVSIDYNGSSYATIVDALSTIVMDGTMVKVILWYDNEWGYSSRLIELISHIAQKDAKI